MKKICIFLLVVLVLAGCAHFEDMGIKPKLPEKQSEAERLHRQITEKGPSYFKDVDRYYISGEAVPFMEHQKFPDYFNEDMTLVGSLYFNGIADQVSKEFMLPVTLAPDVDKEDINDVAMAVDYQGTLKRFLDSVASYYDLYWEYTDGGILFYRTITETFNLVATMTTSSLKSELTNTSTGGGSTSNTSEQTSTESQQSVSSELEVAAWEEAVESIKKMLTDEDNVAANKAAATVTVTDAPAIVHRVGKYIEALNDRQARQVSINVTAFSFTASDTRDRGVGGDLVFTDINGASIQVLGGDAGKALDGAGSFKASIMSSDSVSSDSLRAFYGSNFLISALRERGKVSNIKCGSAMGLNNQPISVRSLNNVGYISKVSGTTSESGSTTTSTLEQGRIATGFNLLAVPNVLSDNRMILDFSLILSQLQSLDEKESGDYKIQLPNTLSQSFSEKVMLRPGSTLVLAGFANNLLSDERADGALSLGTSESDTREIIVVAIDINDVTIPGI